MDDAPCSELARVEPMAGTAAYKPRWLCLEYPRPWPGGRSADIEPAVAELAARSAAAGWRLTFIRRPGRVTRPSDGHQVLFADTTLGSCRMYGLEIAHPAELLDLDLAALAAQNGPAPPGTPLPDPALLLCTHGGRDPCCAFAGRALMRAIDAVRWTWECSHLGGHRFAPTAVVLPTGYVYGRLDPGAAVAVRKAAALGEVELAHCRGRSTWPAAGQVAELAVRTLVGLLDAAALAVEPASFGTDHSGTVIVRQDVGRVWQVRVGRAEMAGARPLSCGAEPAPIRPLLAESIQELDEPGQTR
jgi:hypothetical protein